MIKFKYFERLRLVPSASVPIYFKDIIKSICCSIFYRRERLQNEFNINIINNTGYSFVRTFQSGYLSLYHLLNRIKGEREKGEIIIPVYTCPSVYYAVKNAKLIPVFTDSDSITLNNSLNYLSQKISKNTLAIVIIHIFGCYSVNIKELRNLLHNIGRNDIVIIEDMCQSLGNITTFRNSMDEYGDYGILSFGRAKMISTINGGAVVSNNSDILEIRSESKSIGIGDNLCFILKSIIFAIIIKPWFYRISNSILTNKRSLDPFNLSDYKSIDHCVYELSNYQLSLGINMLNRLEEFNKMRKMNAKFYLKYFGQKTNYRIQPITNNFYLRFSVIFKSQLEREFVKKFLLKKGIATTTVDYPLLSTINNYYASTFSIDFPNASSIASNILTFPTHPNVIMLKYEYVFDELLRELEKNKINYNL